MNNFASTDSNPGLLKDTYGGTGLSDALEKKRKKMAENRGIEVKDDEEEDKDAGT